MLSEGVKTQTVPIQEEGAAFRDVTVKVTGDYSSPVPQSRPGIWSSSQRAQPATSQNRSAAKLPIIWEQRPQLGRRVVLFRKHVHLPAPRTSKLGFPSAQNRRNNLTKEAATGDLKAAAGHRKCHWFASRAGPDGDGRRWEGQEMTSDPVPNRKLARSHRDVVQDHIWRRKGRCRYAIIKSGSSTEKFGFFCSFASNGQEKSSHIEFVQTCGSLRRTH